MKNLQMKDHEGLNMMINIPSDVIKTLGNIEEGELISGSAGVYIPKEFVEMFGLDIEMDIHDEFYFETWEDILDTINVKLYKKYGKVLYTHDDGSLMIGRAK